MPEGPFAHWRRAIQPHPPESHMPSPDALPPAFQFSQNSLQDYIECARRFQLRYVEGTRWPAIQSEPVEEHEKFVEQGVEFHLLVQRHLLGIPAEKLTPLDRPLAEWWEAYLRFPPPDLPAETREPEVQLSVPLGNHRLLAKFDLLATKPGKRAVIVDWKTTRQRPPRSVLAARLQTRVYPFVLVEGGAHHFGGPFAPEQVTLVYWFAGAPTDPEIFPYSSSLHEENRTYLNGLVSEILAYDHGAWPLTANEFHCKYCVYRSLCNRGVQAGQVDAAGFGTDEVDFDFDLDLEHIDEIAF